MIVDQASGLHKRVANSRTHKLFGAGSILEVRDSIVIVQFDNPKIGLRKMEGKFLSKI
jgi:hypothetical protein